MLPPLNGKGSVDPYAPLSGWELIGSSQSATECEEAAEKFRVWAWAQRNSDVMKLDKELDSPNTNEDRKKAILDQAKSVAILSSRRASKKCIASDDPRLQEKFTKSRHATAPLGWYLIAPPLNENGDYRDDTVPLGKWGMAHSFDSVDGCEGKRQELSDDLPVEISEQNAFIKAKCIGTNDPRLNEK